MQIPCGSKIFVEIALSHTISEVNALLRNSRGLPKVAGKRFWRKSCIYPVCRKISSKSLYLAQLRRQKQIRVFAVLAKIQNGRYF